jgi:hypothetical protein
MTLLLQHLTDPNQRLSLNAIRILLELCPVVPSFLTHSLASLLPSLFSCIGSTNLSLKTACETLFGQLSQLANPLVFIQHLVNCVLHGTGKSKSYSLNKLNEVVLRAYVMGLKAELINKYVSNLIKKLTEENRPECMEGLRNLVKIYDRETTGEFLPSLKSRPSEMES